MLEIRLEGIPRLDSLGRKLRVLAFRKLNELTDLLEQKVLENLSGKILQKQSGELFDSVKKTVEQAGDFMTGRVFISPETTKAIVLEKGGEHSYMILPTKQEVLKFIAKDSDTVFAKQVFHPPSKEFAYLRSAIEEMAPLVPVEYQEAIEAMLSGGAFE
jgi:hypothetical protein